MKLTHFPRRALATLGIAVVGVTLPVLSLPAGAATTSTVPAKAPTTIAASAASTKAPKTTKAPAASPPRAGNFCKKTLKGTSAVDAKGVKLICKADAKGKLRWTK